MHEEAEDEDWIANKYFVFTKERQHCDSGGRM